MKLKDVLQINDIDHLRAVATALWSSQNLLLQRLKLLTEELARATGTSQVRLLEEELRIVHERLTEMSGEKFGASRSERRGAPVPDPPATGGNGAEATGSGPPAQEEAPNGASAGPSDSEGAPAPIPPAPKPKKGHGPRPQPSLPIREVEHRLDDADRMCPTCGGKLLTMKGQEEVSEQIDVLSMRFEIVLHKLEKCRCGRCGHIETALPPEKLIPGGRYSIGVAAEVATGKYGDHLPLERQADQMERQGLVVTSQTLWDQLKALYKVLLPSYLALQARILAEKLIHVDETTWRLMLKGGTQKWWVWCLVVPDAAFVQILPSRGNSAARSILDGYSGIVVADGYSVYGSLERERSRLGGEQVPLVTPPGAPPVKPLPRPDYELAVCWSHARRPLVKGEKNYPDAKRALDLIAALYAVEAEAERLATDRSSLLEHRGRLRKERSAGLIRDLRVWMDAQQTIPGSQLDRGVQYLREYWVGLTVFLRNPIVPLDNNLAERVLRGPVLGRVNHQGSRSEAGTRVSALFYSLVITCKLINLDPGLYLREAARRALRDPNAITLPHDLKAELDAAVP